MMKWIEVDTQNRTLIGLLKTALVKEFKLQRETPEPFRKTSPREDLYFSGALDLGIIPHHKFPYRVELESFKKHWLIAGTTGGGKTTLIKNIIIQTLSQPAPPTFMILERKQEFTELLSMFPDLQILDAKHLAFNPLHPPDGIPTAQWISIFTECMINHLDIREASSSFILDHALRKIEEMKKEGKYPNLGDLYTFIKGTSYPAMSKNGQQKETVLNRFNDLLNHLPDMFNTKKQTDLDKLINNHCLILLHDITHNAE
jgi:type IV secretory pathway VirB4 component